MTEQVALAGPAAYSPVEFLTEQRTMINNALQGGGTRDEVTTQHLRDAIDEIATILDARAMRDRGGAAGAAAAGGRGGGGGGGQR